MRWLLDFIGGSDIYKYKYTNHNNLLRYRIRHLIWSISPPSCLSLCYVTGTVGVFSSVVCSLSNLKVNPCRYICLFCLSNLLKCPVSHSLTLSKIMVSWNSPQSILFWSCICRTWLFSGCTHRYRLWLVTYFRSRPALCISVRRYQREEGTCRSLWAGRGRSVRSGSLAVVIWPPLLTGSLAGCKVTDAA